MGFLMLPIMQNTCPTDFRDPTHQMSSLCQRSSEFLHPDGPCIPTIHRLTQQKAPTEQTFQPLATEEHRGVLGLERFEPAIRALLGRAALGRRLLHQTRTVSPSHIATAGALFVELGSPALMQKERI